MIYQKIVKGCVYASIVFNEIVLFCCKTKCYSQGMI